MNCGLSAAEARNLLASGAMRLPAPAPDHALERQRRLDRERKRAWRQRNPELWRARNRRYVAAYRARTISNHRQGDHPAAARVKVIRIDNSLSNNAAATTGTASLGLEL